MNRMTPSSMEELAVLVAIALSVLLALYFFYAAVRAKKQELIDKRLAGFVSAPMANSEKTALPARIDLEKGEGVDTELNGKPRFFPFFGGASGTQDQFLDFIRAGVNPKRAHRYFFLARIGAFCLGICGSALLLGTPFAGLFSFPVTLALIAMAGIVAGFLPYAFLRYRIRRRQRMIERAMPDLVDLMILCVEAGLTLEVALARAIEGLEPFAPELASEMKITLSELRILPDKSMALTNLEHRTASKSLKYLVLSLRQSERYGTSITGALKSVAVENRKHAMLELENNAARMPALLSVPLILFILPPVVALAAGPGFVLMMRAIRG